MDPGLLLKKCDTNENMLFIAQHIDDSLTIGRIEEIKKLQQHMINCGLQTKCEELDEYLGNTIIFSKDKKSLDWTS